ncbi:hypothetical protein ACFSS8_04690 [Paracoccus kondratievae]
MSLHLGPAGRIAVASPYLFDGYAEPDLPLPPREEGHLVTGDIGWLDGAGHLFLRGRESRMVLVADRNLFLEDVEAALATAGAGLCAALAVPDPRRGHSVLAVVEGQGDDTLAARLRRACREALGITLPRVASSFCRVCQCLPRASRIWRCWHAALGQKHERSCHPCCASQCCRAA